MVGRVVDAETGLIYLRARYYDPQTAQFISVDPLVGQTRSAYGYVDNNPLNGTDPLGLNPWDGLCVKGVNCGSGSGEPAWKQPVANFAGGVLNTVTFGNENSIDSAIGNGDKVDRCSGSYSAGEYAGYAVDAVDLAAAGKDFFSKGGLRLFGERFAKAAVHEDIHPGIRFLGREFDSPHLQLNWWERGVKGSGGVKRWPLPS